MYQEIFYDYKMDMYVSSRVCSNYGESDICVLLPFSKCQISKFVCQNINSIEVGFHIKFLESPSRQDIIHIWNILRNQLLLKCAYIKKHGTYEGCILNWSNVFALTKCPSKL